jgi:hypothetical protein
MKNEKETAKETAKETKEHSIYGFTSQKQADDLIQIVHKFRRDWVDDVPSEERRDK